MGVRERPRVRQNMLAVEFDFYLPDGRRVYEVAAFLPVTDGKVNEKDRKKAHKAAAEMLADRKLEVKQGRYVHPADQRKADAAEAAAAALRDVTFEDFGKRFLLEYASTKRSGFYQGRVKVLTRTFGPRTLRSFTKADLDAWTADRMRQVKSSTVRRELAVLSVMFKMAVRWGVLDSSPAVDLIRPKEPSHKTRFLTRDEWSRLDAVLPPWLKPIATVAVLTGLRLKEVTGLRWDGYDAKAGVMHLDADNKTATVRAVPLSAEARKVVDAIRVELDDARRQEARAIGAVPKMPSHVFRDDKGNPHTSTQQRGRITVATIAAMKAAGIRDASFHTLRHTAATWMVQAGVPLFEVQRILGHSTPLMTQRYANLVPEDLRGAVERLAAAFRSEPSADSDRSEMGISSGIDTNGTAAVKSAAAKP